MSCQRCDWVTADPHYISYHDIEWGTPVKNSQQLFEMLCLEGQQAGLSWITVLRKRDNYRQAFHDFKPPCVAAMTEDDIVLLLQDSGLIRNRKKIEAIISNAHAYLAMEKAGEAFSSFIWSFVDGVPQINHWQNIQQIPAQTSCSDAMAKALKKRGFKFVGSTICYAFMQACGLVNDHVITCFRYHELSSNVNMTR